MILKKKVGLAILAFVMLAKGNSAGAMERILAAANFPFVGSIFAQEWTLTALEVVSTFLAFIALWVVVLRRKVHEQTIHLQENESKFRSLVEKSLVGVYMVQEGKFVYANPRLVEMLGRTVDEMKSFPLEKVIHSEDLAMVKEQIARRAKGELTTVNYQFRVRRKDGTLVYLEALSSQTEYEGKPAVLGTAMDITERKRAEDDLFNSRQMLRTVLDTIPQRVFWKNRNSVLVGCNKAFALDRGCSNPSELVGKSEQELPAPEIFGDNEVENQEILASGKTILNCEVPQTKSDGSQVWLKINKVPLFDKGGKVNGVLGTYENITDRKRAETDLAQASSLLESLLASSPDYIYFKDAQSRFVRTSRSLARIFKTDDTTELRGKSDFDFFLPEHARTAFDDEQEIMQTGKPLIGKPEKEIHLDGRTTWALTTKLPWHDKDGKIIGTFGISKDVTEIKEAEQKLAQERGLFRALVENLPDAIYFKDRESRFVRLSQSKVERARQILIEKFLAANPNEELPTHLADSTACAEFLIGKSDFDIFDGERAQSAYEQEQMILRTGKPLIGHIEKYTSTRDGKTVWYYTTKMPWHDDAGNIIGTFGVTRDITALKEAESILDYERELFRTLLDQFPDPIYFKDLESRFVRISRSEADRAFEASQIEFTAAHPDEPLPEHVTSIEAFSEYLIGKTDFETHSEAQARQAYDDEQHIIATGEPLIGKVERATRSDGKTAWFISTKMPWCDQDGRIIGTFGVSKDITALKDAESQLEAAHQRLVETSRLAGMAEVATDVLHNVGNVLNSVNVSCSLTMDRIRASKISSLPKVSGLLAEHRDRLGEFFTSDPRGQQIPEYLAALAEHLRNDQTLLLDELSQLLRHIDHIKQIVAMQQSYAKVAGVKETISPNQLLEDALQINAAALVRHDVIVRREFQPTPPIITEKHKVLQILVNLIRNAKYAMDEAKHADKLLTLKLGMAEGGAVRIDVIDNGIGIPQENLTRIFGHGFTTRKNGHGFGLHSSAIAVRELGGSILAHSDGPGTGATFTLILPSKPVVQPEPIQYEPAAV